MKIFYKKNVFLFELIAIFLQSLIGSQRPDLSDWLPLTLEVKKLEVLQTELQRELGKLEEKFPEDNMMIDDILTQLIAEIKTIDSKIVLTNFQIHYSF